MSLQAQIHPLWSQEEGGHGSCVPRDTPTLLTDHTEFSIILENVIMHSPKNSSNILSCTSGLYSWGFFWLEKYEVKEMAA